MNNLLPYILVLILLAANLAIAAIIFHKTRRIHLAIHEIKNHTIRNQTDTLFSQIQSLLALDRKLGMSEPLPPTRGWAGSPDFLLQVTEETLKRKPTTVLECSSGVSTIVIARCLEINRKGHVYSLEHEREYADKTNQLLSKYGLTDWATVLYAPLTEQSAGIPWYSAAAIPQDLPPVDMVVVDGPPASPGILARFPALPNLMPRLAPLWSMILDDTNRREETEMLRQWTELYPHIHLSDKHCEKGCVLITPTAD